jgi:hypothetical protein
MAVANCQQLVFAGATSGPGGTPSSLFTFNPFFNYYFDGDWFAGSVPIITANWNGSGAKWTLPVGARVGRLIKIGGKLPLNLPIGAYYSATRPGCEATSQQRHAGLFRAGCATLPLALSA